MIANGNARLSRTPSSPSGQEKASFIASNRARSREGHAAAPMGIKDDDQRWVQIQQKTFTNWVNEQLKSVGKRVDNLQTDFQDGLNLIALIEVLQGRRIGKAFQNPVNQHQMLENVQLALNAMMDDNIKLVNIGNQDIVEGNLKLILGLIWTLILRYQIGKTNLPPKKLMLAWLQAVLPNMKIKNFTRDWSDGVALSGLLEYCRPGLFPNWETLDKTKRVENCRRAMEIAEREFGIPMLISPEDLSSNDLDELSGMTYLSYFMNSANSPGYKATLRWVKGQIPAENVDNFTMDWNDGRVVGALVKSLGGTVPSYSTQTYDRYNWEDNLQRGFKGGRELGVEPILTPKQMAEAVDEHLGIMAYAAWFQWVNPLPKRKGGDKIRVSGEGLHTAYVGKPAHFQVQYVDDVNPATIRAELRGPHGVVPIKFKLGENGGSASYTPTESGPHELVIYCEGEMIKECPRRVRVHPDVSRISFAGIDKPVSLGSTVDMLVNSNGAGRGELVVEARAPSGRVTKCPVSEHNGSYSAKFQPDEIGEWYISITFDGTHIKGSPFSCHVFDPNAVKVSGLDVGAVGQEMDFAVDTSRAGKGEATVEIFYQGRNVPAKIDTLGNGMYKVTFTPHGPGLYTIHVYFNGVEVRGSPFTIEIFDTSTVSASGEGLKLVPVHKPAFFAINTKGATSKDLQVTVTGPSGRSLPVQILEAGRPNAYKAEYTPTEVGEHSIDIAFFDKAIRGSPFKCYAYDARQIRVGQIPNGFVGKPVEFEIDGSQAGSGNLEILVNGGRVVSHVKALGNQRFLASFTPMDAMTHIVEMRFNGDTVPGSPWNVQIWDPRNVTARDIPKHFQINRATGFEINASNVGSGDLKVEVKSPSMRTISSYTSEVRTGVYKCEFTSSEVGSHSIEISYASTTITGSPFISKGFDASKIKISKISNAIVGLPVQFQVDASQAGEGQLEISINNGRVPNKVDVLGGGKCLVTFTPQNAQPHWIDVKFNGEQVPGCPIQCNVLDTSKITASGPGLERVCVGRLAKFVINTAGAGEAEVVVTITSPSNRQVRSRVSSLAHVGYEVEWTAQEVGSHTVTMEYAGQVIGNGPQHVKAYDPTKVKVSDIANGFVGKPVTFRVDASEAGEGSVEIVVSDQNGRSIATRVEQLSTSRYQISFVATEAVHHRIDITFNKEPVPGTPFGVDIMDASRVQATGEGLRIAQVREVATFQIIAKGAGQETVEVVIDGPDGRKLPVRVLDNHDQTYKVEYVAQMAGEHRITITYGGMKVGASPYVAKAFDVNAIRVGEIPDGIVGKPVTFTVDASQAGSGNLEVAVNNGRVQTSAEALGNNRYAITFTPRSTEPHMIDMKFNGVPVPGCPFRCNIIDASRVVAMGDGLERVPVNKPAWFTIDPRGSGPAECEAVVTAPSGKKVPVRISGSHSSMFKVEYTPTEVGDHLIEVKYAGMPVTGSPFVCRVYDADRVVVTQTKTGIVGKPVSFHVDASQAGAGNLEIVVSVNGKNVPNFVQTEGNAKFKVSFTPQEALSHQVRVRFNNHIVPGTPYDCEIIDGSRCTASGDGLRLVPVNKPAWFVVDPRGAGPAELKVTITAPSGKTVPVSVSGSAQAKFRAEYVPTEVGPHTITVLYAETPISGSPFTCNVYDASRIKVSDIGHGIVGRPVKFQVDASNAGEGKLDVTVTCQGVEVRADIAPVGREKYEVTFVPREVIPHFIDVQFNDTQVDGAPFRCDIIDGSRCTAEGDGLRHACVGEIAWFEIDPRSAGNAEAEVKITSPTGARVPSTMRKTSRGTIRVEYTPSEVGPHKITAKYAETAINGSPFTCEVFDPRNVRLSDLPDGFVGKEYTFRVDASLAGHGEMEIEIESSNRPVKTQVRPTSTPGQFNVSFMPRDAGPHGITVKFGNRIIPGCPQKIMVHDPSLITVTGDGLRRACVGETAWFEIDPRGPATAEAEVKITSPSGARVAVQITKSSRGVFRAEYVATEVGSHKISCKYAETTLTGSPFICEAYDPRQVKITGLHDGYVAKESTFAVDTSTAGQGEIEVEIEGNNVPVKNTIRSAGNGQYEVAFTPRDAGVHGITVKFVSRIVPGCPHKITVHDPSLIRVSGDGLKRACVGEMAWFEIDPRGGTADAGVKITSPSGAKVPCQITKNSRGVIRVEYTPSEVGPHRISCKYAGIVLTGSPFTCDVFDPRRITIQDLKDGFVGKESTFTIDASAAGIGALEVEVDGNNRPVKSVIRDAGKGMYEVSFTPRDAGLHGINVKFNNHVVPGCPHKIMVHDPSLIRVTGDGLKRACVAEMAWFEIDPRGGTADAAVKITSPSGVVVPCQITKNSRGVIRVEYTPSEVGPHRISCKYAGIVLTGSPFTCDVFDPRRITIQDLKDGLVGKESIFTIDASAAGIGALEVEIDGNNRPVKALLRDAGNGLYEVSFTPRDAGVHGINVKFANHLVPGCPHKITVHDPSLIRVTGDGLKRACVGEMAWFEIDPRGGTAEAAVKITSPAGVMVPCQITKNSRGVIRVEYTPSEVGPHRISCKYAGIILTGSPFTCEVYDPRRITIQDIQDGYVGKESTFTIDASAAGLGELEVEIEGNNRPVKNTITTVGKGLFQVAYTPREAGVHGITVKFVNHVVPGCPHKVNVYDATLIRVTGDGLKRACVGEVAWFEIDPLGGTADAEIKITSPSGVRVPVQITKTSRGIIRAEFVAAEVGSHKISCKYAGMVLTGSPFICEAYDPRKISVHDLQDGYVGKESTFTVDASIAGKGELQVEIEGNNRPVPNVIKSGGHGLYQVSFTPRDAGPHGITVKFANQVVPGCPFKVTVYDPSLIRVSGDGLKRALVGEVAWFEIDPLGGTADAEIKITSPSGTQVPVKIVKSSRGVIRAEFIAAEVGSHKISCKYAGITLTGSPFTCEAYDPRQVKIENLRDGYVGKETVFTIDASTAGLGDLEVEIEGNARPVKNTIRSAGNGLYEVSFTPRDAGPHGITVKFANQVVPGCPHVVMVHDPSLVRATGDGLKRACVGEMAWFEIDPRGGTAEAGVKITSPSGARVPCQITKNSRGIIRVEYTPSEVGPHRISCKYAGTALTGSPFTCEVYDPRQIKVKDLHDGYVGKENSFLIDASQAGHGELEVDVEGGNRPVPCSIHKAASTGMYEVTFVPRDSGPHNISVKFVTRPTPGSPYRIMVHDASLIKVSGDGLKRARVGQKAWFSVEMRGGQLDGNDVEVTVTAPNGSKVPVKLSQQGKGGEVRAEFTPKIVGPHRIDVTFVNEIVNGSPFTCEAYDPSQVRVKDFPDACYVGEQSAFEVISKDAGNAELSVKIFGPSGHPVPVELIDSYDGKRIRFTPTESGKHKLHVMYGGEDTPGSPFTFMVDEPGFPTASGDGLLWALADEPAVFRVDAKNLRGKLEVAVHGPTSIIKTTIAAEKHGIYKVTYLPIEVGTYDIKILWNGKEIPESPFHPKVFDPTKVRVVGGWPAHLDEKDRVRMRVAEEKKILFDVTEAGPGKLSAEVRGPSGLIPVRVETVSKERVKVSFTAVAEGHHDIHIWWSEQPIPHSPFPGWADPAAIPIDASRVRLRGRGLTEAKVREEAEFIIDGSEAGPGEPEVHISGIKADIPVTLQHLGSNVYKATYTAAHHGAYLLTVKWSGEVVKGCPYKLNVAAGTDASKVVVSGENLKNAMLGKEIKSFIDTRRAGPGELSVHCMGPTKQAYCELFDHRDGTYTLHIKPAEAGRHLLTIKYNGEHVPGSPFAIKIAGSPDPSKVRVYGPGVNHGVLATYTSRFMCETKGAGAGQLTVRVRGPKGAFRVEMQRESQKDRTILCKYDPTEPGDYRIEVKWSGEHVPGSPFNIWIFDTEEELNRFLRTGEVPRSSSPSLPQAYGPVSEYTYGNGHVGNYATPPPHNATPYSQWRRGSADI